MPFDRYRFTLALYMALILALSSIPGADGSGTPAGAAAWIPPILSNALHLPVYAVLAWLWAWTLCYSVHLSTRRAALIALALAMVFGGLDELYQGLVPGRTTAIGDWLADATGALFGCLAFLRWQNRECGSQ